MNTIGQPTAPRVPLGAPGVDDRLGGGLVHGALHEVYGANGDHGVAAAFAFMLAMRAAAAKPVFVLRDDRCVRADGRLYGLGVVALGGDPAAVVIVHTPDAPTLLRAAADVIACPAVGAAVVEPWDPAPMFDLTASRRIAWRAAATGVFTLFVRHGDPGPSAATTRWRVRPAPSTALAAGAPGSPALDIELLRHRGGVAGFCARVEWNCATRQFEDAPRPAALVGDAGGDRRAA